MRRRAPIRTTMMNHQLALEIKVAKRRQIHHLKLQFLCWRPAKRQSPYIAKALSELKDSSSISKSIFQLLDSEDVLMRRIVCIGKQQERLRGANNSNYGISKSRILLIMQKRRGGSKQNKTKKSCSSVLVKQLVPKTRE